MIASQLPADLRLVSTSQLLAYRMRRGMHFGLLEINYNERR
jgi:hypothetical protein